MKILLWVGGGGGGGGKRFIRPLHTSGQNIFSLSETKMGCKYLVRLCNGIPLPPPPPPPTQGDGSGIIVTHLYLLRQAS